MLLISKTLISLIQEGTIDAQLVAFDICEQHGLIMPADTVSTSLWHLAGQGRTGMRNHSASISSRWDGFSDPIVTGVLGYPGRPGCSGKFATRMSIAGERGHINSGWSRWSGFSIRHYANPPNFLFQMPSPTATGAPPGITGL